ncbi:MAG: hypothetical protein SF052_02100 [Bacteroidia bacterium]|nr:hypothetical protein [Bacteroidia bacterium]
MKLTTTIKAIVRSLGFFALIPGVSMVLLLSSCGGSDEKTAEETATAETTQPETKGGVTFTDADIKALKEKFTFDEAAGFYYHNHWNKSWPKRRTLTADVAKTGYYYLCSNFYGNKGIKHNYVTVSFGEEKSSSEKVELTNDAEHRLGNTDDGNLYEVNYYTNYRDNKIFETIGKSESADNIKVRFVGAVSYTEEPLPKSDYDALKDCYQLSLVLRFEAAQQQQ